MSNKKKAIALEALLEEARQARSSGDVLRLRGLSADLELATRAMDASDPIVADARELSTELERRRKEIETALRRRVAQPCTNCGSRQMLLSEPAEFDKLYVPSRKVWGLRFRLVVCRGCGRTRLFAQEPGELAKDDRFSHIEVDPDDGGGDPYR